jgi:hypothetical protein
MDDPLGGKEVVAMTKEFLSPVGETLSDAWRAIVGDRVSHWRLKNAMALQKKTNEEAQRLGLRFRPEFIPERYAFAWFEEATKQDEPEIQVLFARLLARAAAGEDGADDRRLIGLLRELTPADAAVFQRVYSDRPFPDNGIYSDTVAIGSPGGFAKEKWPRDWMTALVEHFHPGQAEAAIENLIRTGCLGETLVAEGERNRPPLPRPEYLDRVDWRKLIQGFSALRGYVTATALGKKLAAAVRD